MRVPAGVSRAEILEDVRVELSGRWPLLRRQLPVWPVDEGWIVLDARRLIFACPLDLAGIVAMARVAAASGARVGLLAPCDAGVASYLQRMDVVRQLPAGSEIDGRLPDQQRADRSRVLLEVSPVSAGTVEGIVARAGRMIAAKFESGIRGLVFTAVGELIDNAASHGASEQGAFMAAQAYTGRISGRRGLEFAVCDTGIGVLAHLRCNPAHRHLPDASSALAKALEPGVTGTGDQRGHGLADLLQVTRAGGVARLVMRSGNGIASIVVRRLDRHATHTESTPAVAGTWAWLRVRYP